MPLLVPRVALASSIHPPAHPLRALQHHPSYSRARCPCVAIYIKRWSVASRSAETRASVAEGRPTEKEKALGKGGRVEREGGTCVPPSLSLSPSRSHATDRGEDRPKIRGYETQRRPNTRQRFARQKRDFLDPCLSIANPSHLSRCFSRFRARVLPTFPGYLPNFPIFLSLSLFLCLFLSFAFPRSCFLSTSTSSLSLLSLSRIFLRIRSRGMNGNGRHVRIRPRIVFDLLVLTYLVERATSELVSIGSIRASKNASRKSRHSRRGRDKETRIRPISSRQEITFFPSRVKLKENGGPLFRFQRFIN